MATTKKSSRWYLSIGAMVLIAAALGAAFWPRAVMVDIGQVTRGAMSVTIDEEGRTRVRDAYVVSTQVAGRLQRVQVNPGDPVVRGESVVAHMRPSSPAALDARTREQARSAVDAANASLQVARAELKSAIANRDLAQSELARSKELSRRGLTADAALDRSIQEARVAQANVETAEAAIAMRQAQRANAQSQLVDFDDRGGRAGNNVASDDIPITAPATGIILQIMQQSETTLPAGTPIMEIGDVGGDLEVVVELLSTDAVKVAVGDRVVIDEWGGAAAIEGEIVRVDPFGVSKFSALGVEEQRVNAVIRITSPADAHMGLGHGFRVEARIVVWEEDNTLIAPASALFRDQGGWAVFQVVNGKTALQPIKLGHNNGVEAQVQDGLSEGDAVVLFPASGLVEGASVRQREVQ